MKPVEILIDTSSPLGVIDFLEKGISVHRECWGPGKDHSEKLILHFQKGLQHTSREPNDVKGIFIGLGPGSFTGLRVSHAFCKAFSFTHMVPIFGFPSSRLAAYEAINLFEELNIFCIVSRSVGNRYFSSHYKLLKNGWQETVSKSAIPSEEVFSDKIPFFSYDSNTQGATTIEQLGGDLSQSENFIDFCNRNSLQFCKSSHLDLTPLYLRQSEAEEKLKREDSKHYVTK